MTAQASHNDIMREVGAMSQQVENLEIRADRHDERFAAIQAKVDDNGRLTADAINLLKELREDTAAIKAKVLAYDLLKARVIGAAMAAAVAWAAFWTLTGGKITAFFNGSAPP